MAGVRILDVIDTKCCHLLDNLIGQLVIDVADERLAAHCDSLVGNGDPLLDVLRDHGHDAERQLFLGRSGRTLIVNHGTRCGTLERLLEIATDKGLRDTAHDLIVLPSGLDDVANDCRNRQNAGCVHGQKCAALLVIPGLDVVCECVNVFAAFQYVFHCSFLLLWNGFDDLASTLCDCQHIGLACFDLGSDCRPALLDGIQLIVQRVELFGIGIGDFRLNSLRPLIDLFHCHGLDLFKHGLKPPSLLLL